jgi:hypothetical protein
MGGSQIFFHLDGWKKLRSQILSFNLDGWGPKFFHLDGWKKLGSQILSFGWMEGIGVTNSFISFGWMGGATLFSIPNSMECLAVGSPGVVPACGHFEICIKDKLSIFYYRTYWAR